MNELREIVINNFADAAVVDNYRISADGTLTKRDGFRTLAVLGEHIRGFCQVGTGTIYAVAGSMLYRIEDGEVTMLGELSEAMFESETERCLMYAYAGIIYIIGGNAFHCYDTTDELAKPKTFERIPIRASGVSEYPKTPYNLISDRAYAVATFSANAKTLTLSDETAVICSATLGGVRLDESQYSVTSSNGLRVIKVTDTSILVGTQLFVLEYIVRQEDFANKKELCSKCNSAYVFEGESGVRVLLYGGEEGCIYYSEATAMPIDEETGEAATELTPGTLIGDYYSPEGSAFTLGDGEKILNILPFGTRTLVITDRATYYLVEDTKTVGGVLVLKSFRLVSMGKELGVSESSGVVSYDGKIYFMSSLGLYYMSYNPIEDKYSTYRINIPDNVVSRDDYGLVRLHVDRVNHELWVQNGGKCAVYSFNTKKWYRFSGFCPSAFFTYQNASAFTEADKICVFTVGETLDGGKGFEAYVETYNLDLGNIFAEKTVYSFGATFERCDGAALECTLKSDKGATFTFRISADDNNADTTPVVKRTHARLGNCYYVICRVSSPADAASANLRSILISYRVMGGNV